MTVIEKANELIETVGRDAAIKYFEDKINQILPCDFETMCKRSGWKIAIEYIKETTPPNPGR